MKAYRLILSDDNQTTYLTNEEQYELLAIQNNINTIVELVSYSGSYSLSFRIMNTTAEFGNDTLLKILFYSLVDGVDLFISQYQHPECTMVYPYNEKLYTERTWVPSQLLVYLMKPIAINSEIKIECTNINPACKDVCYLNTYIQRGRTWVTN